MSDATYIAEIPMDFLVGKEYFGIDVTILAIIIIFIFFIALLYLKSRGK